MPNLETPRTVSTPPKKEPEPAPPKQPEAAPPDDAVEVADRVKKTPDAPTPEPKPKPVVKAPRKPEKKPLKPPAPRPDAGETAAAEVESPVKDAPEEPVSLGMVDQKNFRHSYYLELIRARLAKEWNEPRTDARVTKVSVHFVIRKDGTVTAVEIREASGSGVYDRAALAAVRGVDRFPPLPESYAGDEIGITVVFQTMLEGR
jgi:protein TonB